MSADMYADMSADMYADMSADAIVVYFNFCYFALFGGNDNLSFCTMTIVSVWSVLFIYLFINMLNELVTNEYVFIQ